MSSAGSPFDWNQLAMQFGMGMLGQPNLAASIGGGAANLGQNLQYQNLLKSLYAPAQNTITPAAPTLDPGPMKPVNVGGPATMTPTPGTGGMLAGGNPQMQALLQSLPASQGSPLVNSILSNAISPHGVEVVQTPDGAHIIDKLNGRDLGRVGAAKPMEFDPSKIYALPNDGSSGPPSPGPLLQKPTQPTNPGAPLPSEDQVQGFIKQALPGSTITSGARTQAHNAAVGGVPDSMHLNGNAVDFVLPKGMSFAQAQAVIQQSGVPTTELLNEGDHVHWGWGPKAQPTQLASNSATPQIPGYQTVFGGQPVWQTLSPADAAARGVNIGSQINRVTGEVKPMSTFSMPQSASDSAIKLAGEQLARTGVLPQGMRNPAMMKAVYGAAHDYMAAQGVPEDQIAATLTKAQQDFKAGQAAVTNFDQGTLGNQVRSFNVGLMHLDTLGNLATALQNGDVQAINSLSNTFKSQFGRSAPTNFNAARDIVANEIVKAIVGSGGGVGDRDKAQATVNAAQSPAQLAGVINTYKQLMAGQLKGLAKQYSAATGRNDFAAKYLDPQAQALLGAAPPSTAPKVVHWNDLP